MLSRVIENLQMDIALAQLYIRIRQKTGFFDMARLLESLSIKLFNSSHGLNLINKNVFHSNFPAIDLVDDVESVAVQVTSTANSTKIKHTIEEFERKKMGKKFKTLIIHGFVKCSIPRQALPSYCTILSIEQVISLVIDKHDETLVQGVVDAFEQHHDYCRLHPYDDLGCLEIVFGCINRNAIRHRGAKEGSYRDMVDGLNEITELISKGSIKTRTKGKSVDDFKDRDMRKYLTQIRSLVGDIVGIANEYCDSNSGIVDLPGVQVIEVDAIKQKIVDLSNAIAVSKGSNYVIQ